MPNVRSILSIACLGALTFAAIAACEADEARTEAIACERVYRVCPTMPPATSDEGATCADIFQGRCGAEMRQYVQCATGKCDDAGAIDRVAIENACFSTIDALKECESGEREGGAGPDQGQLPPFSADASTTNDG